MKNKRFIITIVICITLVITFVLLTSYAYWKVQRTQTGSNDIKGACLDIELEEALDENDNPIEGFTLENAWPISNAAAFDLKGYNFKVINKCPDEVIYEVILDSLPVSSGNEMDSHYVFTRLYDKDYVISEDKYDNYDETEALNTDYEKLDSRRIYTGVVPAATDSKNGEVKHKIKIWISDDSPNENIGKEFSSKVRVEAGQNINYYVTPERCFDFEESTGTIIGYHLNDCSKHYLVVPETINGVTVRSIDPFGEGGPTGYDDFDASYFEVVDLSKATGLETIGNLAFVGFNGYKLVFNTGLKNIGEAAFLDLWRGEALIIPEGVETIGYEAFYHFGTEKNSYVYLPSTIRVLDEHALGVVLKAIINMSEEDFYNNVQNNSGLNANNIVFLKE